MAYNLETTGRRHPECFLTLHALKMGMARQSGMKSAADSESRKEGVLYGLLVCALGSIWLAQEIGAIKTELPIGPVIIIVIGFLMLLPFLKK